MSAESGKASEYTSGQQTPVIIKNGDGISGSPDIPVEIYSPAMFFTVVEGSELNWTVSQSTLKGRISELSITESTELEPEDTMQPFPHELASIRIEYGLTQSLVISESGDTTAGDVVLNIESRGGSFNIAKPGMWKEAKARLPRITRVVFMSGNKAHVDREFTKQDATVCVYFLRYVAS